MEIESRLTRSYPKDVAGMPGYLSKLVCAFISLICLGTMAAGQQSPAPIAVATAQISAPITAPLPRPLTLDVLVTNAAGKPVADLEPPDSRYSITINPARFCHSVALTAYWDRSSILQW